MFCLITPDSGSTTSPGKIYARAWDPWQREEALMTGLGVRANLCYIPPSSRRDATEMKGVPPSERPDRAFAYPLPPVFSRTIFKRDPVNEFYNFVGPLGSTKSQGVGIQR